MAKRTIGKPRFYAPLDQYLKAKGYYKGARTGNMTEFVQGEEVWNMNPAQPFEYTLSGTTENPNNTGHFFEFYINTEPPETHDYTGLVPATNKELEMVLSKAPEASDESKSGFYAACLGHKFADRELNWYVQYLGGDGQEGFDRSSVDDYTSFINCGIYPTPVEYNGYSIQHFKNFGAGTYSELAYTMFRLVVLNPDGVLNEGETESMGSVSWGRWFEPEHSLDLQATITDSYDGIKAQTTIGGNTLTNINYLSHDWGDLPAWTLEKQIGNDYKVGGRDGRRQWKVSLSYLQDDDLFHTSNNENQFFTWTDPQEETGGEPEYKFDASMSSFFKMTLMGKLPFIFNPDSSATNKEFAICRITNKPSFKQVANNLFSTNLVITEVF